MNSAEQLQREYYARAAAAYEHSHEHGGSAHDRALEHLVAILGGLPCSSFLDVGSGTGRALRKLRDELPALKLFGIEPSAAMIERAEAAGLPGGILREGTGDRLPFADGSIDVVAAFGVMHHVPDPNRVIAEMARVARKAVFISDSNRFAQGRPLARSVKVALATLGLWQTFDLIRTLGRRYMVSVGDGVYYSYSVFDSLPALRRFANELMLVELESAPTPMPRFRGPLCNATSLLVGAIKR